MPKTEPLEVQTEPLTPRREPADRKRRPSSPGSPGSRPAVLGSRVRRASHELVVAQEACDDDALPPPSRTEQARDDLLQFMERPCWARLAVVHLVWIIGDGALFFFLLMNWQAMCTPDEDGLCEPRNWWYNLSIQVLNVLFTYGVLVTMPWRLANAHHLCCSPCSSQAGCDFYGRPSHAIWFHIPPAHRKGVLLLLLGNTFGQFINQATRIVYSDFHSQNIYPGNLWTNVFFCQNFLCAFSGAAYQAMQERQLRRVQPGRFPPGPLEAALEGSGLVGRAYRKWRARGGRSLFPQHKAVAVAVGASEPTLNARQLPEPRPSGIDDRTRRSSREVQPCSAEDSRAFDL